MNSEQIREVEKTVFITASNCSLAVLDNDRIEYLLSVGSLAGMERILAILGEENLRKGVDKICFEMEKLGIAFKNMDKRAKSDFESVKRN